jgi:pyrimidine 5'-nucleotidase
MNFETIFIDLDDTVYPADSGVWKAIRQRIDLFVAEKFALPPEEAARLRQKLFLEYGTTMRGLQAVYHIDEDEYLAFVHHVPLADFIQPDPALAAGLKQIPQRKIIFTNADVPHARRVLAVLGLQDCFEAIIDIKAMAPYCKPMPPAFAIALRQAGVQDPARCILVDDQPHNIRAARALGLYTVRVSAAGPDPEAHATIARLADLPAVVSTALPGSSQPAPLV